MSEFFTLRDPPPLPPRRNDEHNVYGEGWHAFHTADGYLLGWDGGGIVGKAVEVRISEAEFERLRDEPDSFREIQFAHDPHR